ncbi:hypothetical protein GCM10023115_32350 [Pontixanthobacter gangjinensis]|uniref:Uncharacterized protein n=1 Tax=Christiangramia aestuarii TaxID=1028746 RepID=A0A7K1LNZ2_9FLAO|nr:hypothetical protein [Christiangramia aestuarii]MUP42463.1 hypothetical protein [Christiangramia aestuarii]
MKENLLPYQYKNIGLALGILGVLAYIGLEVYLENQPLKLLDPLVAKWIIKDIFLIGLCLIAFANEKEETNQISLLRAEYFKKAFIFGVSIFILGTISEMIFSKGNFDLKTAYEILVMVLLFYLVTYNFRKNDKI